MPSMELTFRHQKAVLWEKRGDDSHGQPKVIGPVEILVRWNDAQRIMAGPEGNPITVDATVVVAQDIEPGSVMWLGELDDWYGTGSGGDESNLMEVVAVDKTLDIKGRVARRELGLKFYRDTLPEIA